MCSHYFLSLCSSAFCCFCLLRQLPSEGAWPLLTTERWVYFIVISLQLLLSVDINCNWDFECNFFFLANSVLSSRCRVLRHPLCPVPAYRRCDPSLHPQIVPQSCMCPPHPHAHTRMSVFNSQKPDSVYVCVPTVWLLWPGRNYADNHGYYQHLSTADICSGNSYFYLFCKPHPLN